MSTGRKKQWQGWHNTDRKDIIFIVVPCKGHLAERPNCCRQKSSEGSHQKE